MIHTRRPAWLSWGIAFLLACMMIGATAGCRIDDLPQDETIRISLVGPLFPPSQGAGQLTFRVTDENEAPIDTAALRVRGDMNHAGMVPIQASVEGGENGLYQVPIEWTMLGDWVLTVEAQLSDGRASARTFDIQVSGEEALCTEEE